MKQWLFMFVILLCSSTVVLAECTDSEPTVAAASTTLFCDDVNDGTWYVTSEDIENPLNDGWNGTIFADIEDNGVVTNGLGNTGYKFTSGFLNGHRGQGMMGDVNFANKSGSFSCGSGNFCYDEIYIRYYIQTSEDTLWAGEKMMTINKCCAGVGGIHFTNHASGMSGAGCGADEPGEAGCAEFNIVNTGIDQWMGQNLSTGSTPFCGTSPVKDCGVLPNMHWYFVQMRYKRNTTCTIIKTSATCNETTWGQRFANGDPVGATGNAEWEVWINDCGTDGFTNCVRGVDTPTKRSSHSGFASHWDTSERIGSVWFENWANAAPGVPVTSDGCVVDLRGGNDQDPLYEPCDGTRGTHYYDNFVISTAPIGFAEPLDGDTTPPAAPVSTFIVKKAP